MGLTGNLLSLIKQEVTLNFEVIYGENQEPIYYDPYVAFAARQVEAQQSAAAVEIDPIIQPEDYKSQAHELISKLTEFHSKFDNLRQYFPFTYKVTDTDEEKLQIQSEINEIKKFAEIILQHFLNLQSQSIDTVYAASYVTDKVFVCPAGGRENMQAIASSFANNIQSLLYNAKEIYLSEVASTFVAHLPTDGMHIHWSTALMMAASDKYNIKIAKDSLANPDIIYKEAFLSKLALQENSLKSVEHIVRIITDNIIRDFPVKFDEDPNILANQIAQIISKLNIIDPSQAKYILDKIYDTEDGIIYKYHDNYQEVVTAFVTKSLHEQGYLDASVITIDNITILPTEDYLYNYSNYEYTHLDFANDKLIKDYLSGLFASKDLPSATEIIVKLDKNGNSLIANYFKEVLFYYRNTEQIANLLKQSLISNNHQAFNKIIEENELQKNIQEIFNKQQLVEDLIKYSAQSRGKDVFKKIIEHGTEEILHDPVTIQGLLLESIEYDNHELFDFILSITEADIAKAILMYRDPQTDTTLLDLSIIKNRPLFTKLIANTANSFGILKDLALATNNNLENAALLAVKKDNIEAISSILELLSPDEREKILNFEDSQGWTPLIYAFLHNKIEAISTILEPLEPDEKVKILNFENSKVGTPLIYAIYNNKIEAIRTILEPLEPDEKVKILNFEDSKDWTPLRYAIYHNKIESISSILKPLKPYEREKILNFEDSKGLTPLTYAIRFDNIEAISTILELLSIDERVEILNFENSKLGTPLIYAIKNNKIQAISRILGPLEPDEREKILNFKDSQGKTPLISAILHNKIEAISTILWPLEPDEREKILNFEDYICATPLIYAILQNKIEAISVILKLLSPEDQLKLLLTENVIELFKLFTYHKINTEVIKVIIISIKDEALLKFLNKSEFNIDDLINIFSTEENSNILKILNGIKNTLSAEAEEVIEPIVEATVPNNLNVNLLPNTNPAGTYLPSIEGSTPASSPPYSMPEESFSRESILNGFTGVSYVCKTMDLVVDFNKLYYQPTLTNLQTLLTDAHQLSALFLGSNPYLYDFMWYKLETDYAEAGYQKAFTNYYLTTGFMLMSTNIGAAGIYIGAAVAFISIYNSYKNLDTINLNSNKLKSAIAWRDLYEELKKSSLLDQFIDLDELINKKTVEIDEFNKYTSSKITIEDGNKIFQHDEL